MNSKDWRPTAFVDTAPGVVTEPDAEAWRLEQQRLLLAFIRHLMALATVALVLTVPLIEKAFAQPRRHEAVAVAIGAPSWPGRRRPSSPSPPPSARSRVSSSPTGFADPASGRAR